MCLRQYIFLITNIDGKLFHSFGATASKARSPITLGVCNRSPLFDQLKLYPRVSLILVSSKIKLGARLLKALKFCYLPTEDHIEYYYNINHNYNRIVKSDWLSTALISALIGQFNRTVRVMPK